MLPLLSRAAAIVGDGTPNYTALADAIGAPRSALYVWHQVPAGYVLKLEAATGIPRWEIRKDLYPKEDYEPRKRDNGISKQRKLG